MYCKNCGAVNPDGTKFCSVCGAALAPESKGHRNFGLSKNKLIAIIAAAVAAIVFIGAGCRTAKPPYVKKALQYTDNVLSLDAKKQFDAHWPEPFWDYYEPLWDQSFDDIDDVIDYEAEKIDEKIEYFYDELDIDLKKLCKAISVKVTDKEEVKSRKIKYMNEFLEEEMDMDDDAISEAWLVELKVSLKWNDSRLNKKFDEEEDCNVLVVKIDGKWYAIDNADYDYIALRGYAEPNQCNFEGALAKLLLDLFDELDLSDGGLF